MGTWKLLLLFYVHLIFILLCINQLFQSTGDDLCSSLNCPCNYPIIYLGLGVLKSAIDGAKHYRPSYTMWPTTFRGHKLPYCLLVVEFYDPTLRIGKVFGQESTVVKWNYQILGLHQVTVCQKLGVILVIKWFKNWSQQKCFLQKRCA